MNSKFTLKALFTFDLWVLTIFIATLVLDLALESNYVIKYLPISLIVLTSINLFVFLVYLIQGINLPEKLAHKDSSRIRK